MISPKYFLSLAAALFISISVASQTPHTAMERDLDEVTIAKLHEMYAAHKLKVTDVTQWYLDRIARYDSVYKSVLYVDKKGALAAAAAMDAAAAKEGNGFKRGPLWGVPIVIKANMSVNGLITCA